MYSKKHEVHMLSDAGGISDVSLLFCTLLVHIKRKSQAERAQVDLNHIIQCICNGPEVLVHRTCTTYKLVVLMRKR